MFSGVEKYISPGMPIEGYFSDSRFSTSFQFAIRFTSSKYALFVESFKIRNPSGLSNEGDRKYSILALMSPKKKHLDVRFTVEIIRSVRNRIFVVGLCTVVPAVVLDYFPILRTLLRKTE